PAWKAGALPLSYPRAPSGAVGRLQSPVSSQGQNKSILRSGPQLLWTADCLLLTADWNWWAGKDLNLRGPLRPADLQSAAFNQASLPAHAYGQKPAEPAGRSHYRLGGHARSTSNSSRRHAAQWPVFSTRVVAGALARRGRRRL